MLQKYKRFIVILCMGLMAVCLTAGGDARTDGGATLSMVYEDGAWYLTLENPPPDARRGMALLVVFRLAENQLLPIISRAAAAADMALTVGLPRDEADGTAGEVRILLDGRISDDTDGEPLVGGTRRLLRMEPIGGVDADISCVPVAGSLWVMDAEGRAQECSLTVVQTEAEDTETDGASETEAAADETAPATDVPVETRPSSPPEAAETADGGGAVTGAGENDASTSPPTGDEGEIASPIYLGCRETAVRQDEFSVRLLFFAPEGAGSPAVVCMGGGAGVVLTVERVAGTWAVACTYRGLAADGECRFFVYTAAETVEILYRDGRLLYQKPCI